MDNNNITYYLKYNYINCLTFNDRFNVSRNTEQITVNNC